MALAAVQVEQAGDVVLREVEVRAVTAREVRVSMKAAAVCHTDIQALFGGGVGQPPLPSPLVVGHEGAGVVVEIGDNVRGIEVGDHVVLSLRAHDGSCIFCRSGHPALCARSMELSGPAIAPPLLLDGEPATKFGAVSTFTEEIVVPAECAVVIDRRMPLEEACLLGCGVSTGAGAVRNTVQVGPDDTVAVIGCGAVGLSAIHAAYRAGATTIIASDTSSERLEVARRLGATHLVDAKQDDVVEQTRASTGGLGADVSIESSGQTLCMSQAIAAIRPGGTAVLLGMAPTGAPLVIEDVTNMILQEKTVTGSLMGSGAPSSDITRLVADYLAGAFDLGPLITQRRPFTEIGAAIGDLRAGRGIRTVLTF